MIPWVREKFAESRLRWQNRKQQRDELIVPSSSLSLTSPSIATQSADDVRTHAPVTIVRRLDSIEEIPAPTASSAFLELQNSKRRSSSEHAATDTSSTQLVRRVLSITQPQTGSKLNAENEPKNHPKNPGLVGFASTAPPITILFFFFFRPFRFELPIQSGRLINLYIVNSTGAKITLSLPLTLTGIDVKKKAIQMFCHELFQSCDANNILEMSQRFKLTRTSHLHGHFDETVSLAAANVQNDEEMLLTLRYARVIPNNISSLPANHPSMLSQHRYDDYSDSDDTNESLTGPTQEHIESATSNVDAKQFAIPAMVNIDELVLQSDVSIDKSQLVYMNFFIQLFTRNVRSRCNMIFVKSSFH